MTTTLTGLTSAEAGDRLARDGANMLPALALGGEPPSRW
jgi:hypothetical protein